MFLSLLIVLLDTLTMIAEARNDQHAQYAAQSSSTCFSLSNCFLNRKHGLWVAFLVFSLFSHSVAEIKELSFQVFIASYFSQFDYLRGTLYQA